jgi:uncharacterized membrane-anchored protein
MSKLILFSIIAAITSTILIRYDGQILINWQNYQIKLSLLIGICLLVALFIIFYLGLNIIFGFKNKLKSFSYFLKTRNIQHNLNNLKQAFILSASGDFSKAKKLINSDIDQPISNLLTLQIAQNSKDYNTAIPLLNTMLEDTETKLLAYQGLININIQQQKFQEALLLAEQAYKKYSSSPLLLKLLYEIHLSLKNYHKSLNFFNKYSNEANIDSYQKNITKAQLLNLIAKEYLSNNQLSKALKSYQNSVELNPNDLETWYQYIDALIDHGKLTKAVSVTKEAWLHHQNFSLIHKFITSNQNISNIVIMDNLKQLQQLTPTSDTGWLALAYAAIELNLSEDIERYLAKIHDKTLPELQQFKLLFYKKNYYNNELIQLNYDDDK